MLIRWFDHEFFQPKFVGKIVIFLKKYKEKQTKEIQNLKDKINKETDDKVKTKLKIELANMQKTEGIEEVKEKINKKNGIKIPICFPINDNGYLIWSINSFSSKPVLANP